MIVAGERQPPAEAGEAAPILAEWMERDEVAAALGVSADTLRKWQAQRIGPPILRLGRRVLYRRDAVRDWLVSRESGPGAGQHRRGR